MRIAKATRRYEKWLGQHLKLLPADLDKKHQAMAHDPFSFLRATFYRWIQLWPELCPDLSRHFPVLAVGDLHVENFGTWRDAEGRLVWGINDFDESTPLAFTQDLVRLATSAILAAQQKHLRVSPQIACNAILAGYQKSLAAGGRAIVLEEDHGWLRRMALSEARSPEQFWGKLTGLPSTRSVPPRIEKLLRGALPQPDLNCRVVHRAAGLGSLGRQRFLALAEYNGAYVAREAKALAPSAVHCLRGAGAHASDSSRDSGNILSARIVAQAVRCPDPMLRLHDGWLLRRISPHCSRIELDQLAKGRDEAHLLRAMGWETANLHHGTAKARGEIGKALNKLPRNWLLSACKVLLKALNEDWREWRKFKSEK
jgi:uncharacterized protein (DUF2252 family)